MNAPGRPHHLLCESCGYELAGLPASGSCPECDRPVADSLASNRVGSAWQRGATPVSWAITLASTLRRPAGAWRTVRVDAPSSDRLATVNLLLSSSMVGAGMASFAAAHNPADDARLAGWGAVFLAATGSAYFILLVCVSIESVGIQILGRRNGWRVGPVVASAIVGHASFGWLLGALVFFLVGPLAGLARDFDAILTAFYAVAIAAALVGLLSFEGLVYIGMRRMRFANAGGNPGDAISPAPAP
jgi:hypothetical protein